MKYIMGKGNMAVVVDKKSEVRKLKKEGFTQLGIARDYEHAKQKVFEACKTAGYKHVTEVSDSETEHTL